MAATTTTTGDLPSTTPQEPQEPPPPSTQTIPSPLTRTSLTPPPPPPQLQPRPPPPQFLHHPQPRQNHHHPYQSGIFPLPPSVQTQTHLLPRFPKPSDMIRYPLVSSGRGSIIPAHLHRKIHPQLPESEPVPSYPLLVNPNNNSRPHPTPIVRFPFIRRPSSQGHVSVSAPPTAAPSNGVQFNAIHLPSPKAGSSPYTGRESNASKDLTDKKADDMLVTLRDRKVRVSGGASIYALCRSWLRNGYPEDNQPQHGDVLFSLPKPLPLPESSSPKRKECEDETYFEEVATDDILDAEELLARHVKRAKRVRARLREERSQRIERYKSRLALLLPSNGTIQE